MTWSTMVCIERLSRAGDKFLHVLLAMCSRRALWQSGVLVRARLRYPSAVSGRPVVQRHLSPNVIPKSLYTPLNKHSHPPLPEARLAAAEPSLWSVLFQSTVSTSRPRNAPSSCSQSLSMQTLYMTSIVRKTQHNCSKDLNLRGQRLSVS